MAVKLDANVHKQLLRRARRTEEAEAQALAAAQLLALFIYAHGGEVEISRAVMREFQPVGKVQREVGEDRSLIWRYLVDGEQRGALGSDIDINAYMARLIQQVVVDEGYSVRLTKCGPHWKDNGRDGPYLASVEDGPGLGLGGRDHLVYGHEPLEILRRCCEQVLDTGFTQEQDRYGLRGEDPDEPNEPDDNCTNPGGHEWNQTPGEADEARLAGDTDNDRIYCIHCGTDGDA